MATCGQKNMKLLVEKKELETHVKYSLNANSHRKKNKR